MTPDADERVLFRFFGSPVCVSSEMNFSSDSVLFGFLVQSKLPLLLWHRREFNAHTQTHYAWDAFFPFLNLYMKNGFEQQDHWIKMAYS